MFTISIEDSFAAAHYIREYNGKCENLHGHNYKVKIYVSGTELVNGMLIDFILLKKYLHSVLEEFDHKNLNDLPEFTQDEPSAENISCHIFNKLKSFLPVNVCLKGVKIWETEKNSCLYEEN